VRATGVCPAGQLEAAVPHEFLLGRAGCPSLHRLITYHLRMPSTPSRTGIVSFEEARRIVESHAAKAMAAGGGLRGTESVDLLAARGRVLAETILADRDFPPFPRATRDGYAVRSADVERVPARLEVIGEIKAGDAVVDAVSDVAATSSHPNAAQNAAFEWGTHGSITVNRGQAASIMTGAPLPAGADAVVMVEDTTGADPPQPSDITHPNAAESAALGWGTLGRGGTLEKFVEIQRSVASGENFVPQGVEARAGQLLIDKGRRLDHALIGIAAAVGKSRVEVFRKPRVAVLATGDEVVEIGAVPGPAHIRNSNSYSLAAQIDEAGGEPVRLGIARDEPMQLRGLIEHGFKCDLLLITGGVSMGKYDLVEQVLGEMKAEFYFMGAQMQPGKPIVFGSCGAGAPSTIAQGGSAPHYFLGLPGNPVSTMVTFRLFAEPMIAALAGARAEPLVFLKARLKAEVRTKTGLMRFLPAVISGEFGEAEVELAAWQGSGDIAALARANCYLVIPPDRERMAAGEWASVLLP
jgi:molybdopterin molybdotransferase